MTEKTGASTPTSTPIPILRLDSAIAYLRRPEKIECTMCNRTMPVIEARWPRWNAQKKETYWQAIYPQYLCDDCLAMRDATAPEQAQVKITRAGLFGRNRGHSFSTFKPTDQTLARALHQVRAYANAPTHNLWLCGGPGTGKTHLASALVHSLVQRGQRAIFAETAVLLQELIDGFLSIDSPLLKESKWSKASLLVLDDLGMERVTERGLELLTVVVNERGLFERPTVVTSNHEPHELHEHLSERLVSRLIEDGRIVTTGKTDWRAKRK